MGGGSSISFGNPDGIGGGGKNMPSVGGGVDFFWNNPMRVIFDSNRTDKLNWPSI